MGFSLGFFAAWAMLSINTADGPVSAAPDAYESAAEAANSAQLGHGNEFPFLGFSSGQGEDSFNQVRIEQRVTIRIEPRPGAVRQDINTLLAGDDGEPRYEQKAMGRCITASDILGVRATEGSQMLLFLKKRGLILASLERACSARDFYSGFYFERNGDGQMCIEREQLQSRSGAKCQLVQLRRLVALKEGS